LPAADLALSERDDFVAGLTDRHLRTVVLGLRVLKWMVTLDGDAEQYQEGHRRAAAPADVAAAFPDLIQAIVRRVRLAAFLDAHLEKDDESPGLPGFQAGRVRAHHLHAVLIVRVGVERDRRAAGPAGIVSMRLEFFACHESPRARFRSARISSCRCRSSARCSFQRFGRGAEYALSSSLWSWRSQRGQSRDHLLTESNSRPQSLQVCRMAVCRQRGRLFLCRPRLPCARRNRLTLRHGVLTNSEHRCRGIDRRRLEEFNDPHLWAFPLCHVRSFTPYCSRVRRRHRSQSQHRREGPGRRRSASKAGTHPTLRRPEAARTKAATAARPARSDSA
jgi:hypothetical protein